MAQIVTSSPNKRDFEASINCSAQLLYFRSSTMNGDGIHWEKADGGCQKRMI